MSNHRELCMTAAIMADPKCKDPRKRLAEIAHLLDRRQIDLLRVAKACLDDAARDDNPQRQAMWRKQTKRLARERQRRK